MLFKVLGSISADHFLRAQEQTIPKCWNSGRQGKRPAWQSGDLLELVLKMKVRGHWK